MTLIAELFLESDTLPLVDVAAVLPNREIRLVSSVLLGQGEAVFTLDVDDQSCDEFEAEMSHDRQVETATLLGRSRDGLLYQTRVSGLSTVFDPCGPEVFASTPIQTSISSEGWFERKVFANFGTFEELQDRCIESGITLEVLSISSSDPRIEADTDESPLSVLTKRQRQVLETAFSRGYYRSPSRVSLAELGDELDISAASVSGLLGRAEQRLIGHAIDQDGYTPLTG